MIRDMTQEERDFLKVQIATVKPLKNANGSMAAILEKLLFAFGAVLTWVASTFFVIWPVLLAALVVGLLLKVFDWIIGTDIIGFLLGAPYLFIAIVLGIAGVLSAATLLIIQFNTRQLLQAYKKDLRTNKVDANSYHITDAIAFREMEHGGILFFLRTSEDKILCLYDYEAQSTSMETGDKTVPPDIVPRRELTIAYFPNSEIFFDKFSGDPLPQTPILELTPHPRDWPEDHEWIDMPWAQLDSTFSA